MRRQVLCLIAVTISVAICTSSVVAATNQNLQWGFEVNQRFDYHTPWERTFGNVTDSSDNRFYNIVEDLPAIADDIDSIGELPAAPIRTCYFENGTEPPHPHFWNAIPVGNWSLFRDILLDERGINESNIIDTPQLIGFSVTVIDKNFTYFYTEIYSKSTGVLHFLNNSRSGHFFGVNLNSITEIVLIPSVDIPIIYVAVAGGVVLIVLVAIGIMEKR